MAIHSSFRTRYGIQRAVGYYRMSLRALRSKLSIGSSVLPELGFAPVGSRRMFYVEAKYRSRFTGDKLVWAEPHQLKRYREVDRETPVYVAIGLGGKSQHRLKGEQLSYSCAICTNP